MPSGNLHHTEHWWEWHHRMMGKGPFPTIFGIIIKGGTYREQQILGDWPDARRRRNKWNTRIPALRSSFTAAPNENGEFLSALVVLPWAVIYIIHHDCRHSLPGVWHDCCHSLPGVRRDVHVRLQATDDFKNLSKPHKYVPWDINYGGYFRRLSAVVVLAGKCQQIQFISSFEI